MLSAHESDPGEQACLVLAVSRGLMLAIDDADALRALDHHRPGHPHERIRRLLIRAAETGLCTRERANEIHAEMRQGGLLGSRGALPDVSRYLRSRIDLRWHRTQPAVHHRRPDGLAL